MSSSRSDFLKQAAGATIAVAGVGVGAGALAEPAAAVLNNQRVRLLELENVNVGRLADASGGDPEFDVVIADHDADGNPDKLLGGLSHSSEFTIEVGAGMSKPMYDWISSSITDPTVRKNGSIIAADFNHRELARRTFTNAQITSLTIPHLVNRPQSFPSLTVTFTADSVSDESPSSTPSIGPPHKQWLTSNFRLLPTTGWPSNGFPSNGRVASIDSFTWKCSRVAGSPPTNDPGDLACTLAPAAVPAWQQWYDNFALVGDSSDERAAVLTVYSQVPQVPLFTVTVSGMGIFSFPPPPPGVASKPKAKVYISRFSWDLAKGKGA